MDVNAVAAVGTHLSKIEFAAEYGARVTSMQKDALSMEGDMVLKLLDAVAIDPSVGTHMDMRI